MSTIRKFRALVLIIALVAMFAGGLTILSTEKAEARYACCIWVMYCYVDLPICWCECIPVPCP
jgi:hypothetical protein